jgi:hypothetical protein
VGNMRYVRMVSRWSILQSFFLSNLVCHDRYMRNMKIDSLYVVEVGKCLLLSLVPKDSNSWGSYV